MSRASASHKQRPDSASAAARAIDLLAAWVGRLAAGTAILFLATACWLPTFDPDVSGSELTVRKLGEPVARFTLENIEMDEAEAFWFLPERREVPIAGVMNGLLITERGTSLNFTGVQFQPEFDVAFMPSFWERRTNTFGSNYFAQVSPDGNPNATMVAELPSINTIALNPFSSTPVPLPADTVTLGFGAVARPASDIYELTLLNLDTAPPGDPHFERIGWAGNLPALAPDTLGTINFTVASSVKVPGKFLYSDFTSSYYLSCGLSDGSRTIFRWSPDTFSDPLQFPEDHGPLIGGLADGRLLAEKDGLLSVLGPDLELLFAFRSGSLRFVHERWDVVELKMISVFTRALFARTGKDDEGTLRVEIYEIPSSDLYKLGE